MKKKFICFILLLTMLFPFASCKDEAAQKRLDELSEKIQALETENGALNDKIAELEKENQTQANKIAELENRKDFLFEGGFFTLQEAYAYGWLTQEDLLSIAYYLHGNSRIKNEALMDENFTPKPKTPEVLSSELEAFIKFTFWQEALPNAKYDEVSISDFVIIEDYFGNYYTTPNQFCIPLMITSMDLGYAQVLTIETIGGVTFVYGDGQTIKVFVGKLIAVE